MTSYSEAQVDVLNALEVIRNRPRMYLGSDNATGEFLADRMVATLIALGALPTTVARHGPWWVVSSDEDWLNVAGQADVATAFSNIVPTPA
jgi:hypothetical protein